MGDGIAKWIAAALLLILTTVGAIFRTEIVDLRNRNEAQNLRLQAIERWQKDHEHNTAGPFHWQ